MTETVKVSYGILDQTIAEDSRTYSFSGATAYSSGSSLVKTSVKDKLAYLESGYFVLDGSYKFPVESTPTIYDVGWESVNISDQSTGAISEWVRFDFDNTHDSYGIKIRFPKTVSDFTVQYLNGDTIVQTISVVGNTALDYSSTSVALNWTSVKITVAKCQAGQRARISDVVFGMNYDFDQDELISVSAGKAVSIKNDNTDSSEAEIVFYNVGIFDIDSIRDLPVGLQSGLRVNVYLDDVLFNEYIVDSTSAEDDGRVITLDCYDRLYYLNDTDFITGAVYPSGRSLYDWAMDVATSAGIEITVDSSLQSMMSKGYIGTVSHREALRLIAEAANAVIKVDQSQISIVPYSETVGEELTKDDITEDSESLENKEKTLGVKVDVYQFTAKTDIEGLCQIEDIDLTGEEQTVEADYSVSPANPTTVTHSSNITISSQTLRCATARFTFTGTAGETGWITVVGTGYNKSLTTVSKGYMDAHSKEVDNSLITDKARAEAVRDFQFSHSSGAYRYSSETMTDKTLALLAKTKTPQASILVDSLTVDLDESTDSVTVGGEDSSEANV